MASLPPELLEQQNIHPADQPDERGGPYEQLHHDPPQWEAAPDDDEIDSSERERRSWSAS